MLSILLIKIPFTFETNCNLPCLSTKTLFLVLRVKLNIFTPKLKKLKQEIAFCI